MSSKKMVDRKFSNAKLKVLDRYEHFAKELDLQLARIRRETLKKLA